MRQLAARVIASLDFAPATRQIHTHTHTHDSAGPGGDLIKSTTFSHFVVAFESDLWTIASEVCERRRVKQRVTRDAVKKVNDARYNVGRSIGRSVGRSVGRVALRIAIRQLLGR